MKKIISFLLIVLMCFTIVSPTASAAGKIHLAKTKIVITLGGNYSQKLYDKNDKAISSSKITWKSSDSDVAKVDSKGKIKMVGEGKATVSAKYSGKTYKCTVTVKKPTLKYTAKTITSGGNFTQVVYSASGTKVSASKITWSTSNKDVVTVNSKGKITAVDEGTAKVYAKYLGKRYAVKVTVKDATLEYEDYKLEIGDTFTQVIYNCLGDKISHSRLKWSSSDSDIVTVTSKGVVTAENEGTAKIYVTYLGKKYTTKVTVENSHVCVFEKAEGGTDATCTEDGKATYVCECGESNTETIPALGHKYSSWVVDKPATCLEEGSESLPCVRCGFKSEERKIPVGDHSGGTANCQAKAVCAYCGVEYGTIGDHNTVTERVDPTCTADGYEKRSCTICKTVFDTVPVISAGHTYGEWNITKEPTCTETGTRNHKCTVCGEVSADEVVEALGHKYSEWKTGKPVTCTEDGTLIQDCTVCGEQLEMSVVKATGHEYGEWTVKTPATTEYPGVKERVCAKCSGVENEEIPQIEVPEGSTFKKPISGQSDKEITYYSVTESKKIKITVKNVLKGAQANALAAKENPYNTTAGGGYEWRFFFVDLEYISSTAGANDELRASAIFSNSYFYNSNGASLIIRDTAALSGENEGRDPYFVSLYPGAKGSVVIGLLIPQTTGDVLLKVKSSVTENTWVSLSIPEHKYGEWLLVSDASCTTDGLKKRTCSTCGYVDVQPMSAMGHNFGAWIVKQEATTTATGIRERACTRTGCTEKETETIPKLADSNS